MNFGNPGSTVVGPSPVTTSGSSSSSRFALAIASISPFVFELSLYLDNDNVITYEDNFNIFHWLQEHKLTYLILYMLPIDVMYVPVSTISSESCFSLTSRVIEEVQQRLTLEIACIKDWELGEARALHDVEN